MQLYTYFRSSAAYRARIVLNWKRVPYTQSPVHLVRDGGEQRKPSFLAVNPQGLVPALRLDDGTVLVQSLAISEYLEETIPEPPLFPPDPIERAAVRALALAIACDIHPLNNSRVLQYLKQDLRHDAETVQRWIAHWIETGFDAIEGLIGDDGFCHGGRVSVADACLVPQVFNARRYKVDLAPYPRIRKVEAVCGALPAFAAAHPSKQPDAE